MECIHQQTSELALARAEFFEFPMREFLKLTRGPSDWDFLQACGPALRFHAFQQRDNGHGVAVTQFEILLKPRHNRAGFYPRSERSVARKPLLRRESPEVVGAPTGFRLNVGEISLE